MLQAVYPEVQHEAAHQDTQDGPGGCQDTHGPHTQGIVIIIMIIIIKIILIIIIIIIIIVLFNC